MGGGGLIALVIQAVACWSPLGHLQGGLAQVLVCRRVCCGIIVGSLRAPELPVVDWLRLATAAEPGAAARTMPPWLLRAALAECWLLMLAAPARCCCLLLGSHLFFFAKPGSPRAMHGY